jgi:hypothetical protein
MQPLSSAHGGLIFMQTQPVDDIEAVLGRFQAWAGVRNAVDAKAGIRELSDEEALRSSRYRWKGAHHDAMLKNASAALGSAAAEPVTERVRAGDGKRAAAKKVVATKDVAKRGTGGKPDARKSGSALKKLAKAAPEFREALVQAIRPPEALVAAQSVESGRQVAISVRLASAERALIRTRAVEAGITTSAYIRQCALEVEQLRAQVREAIAAMERRGAAPAQPSVRGTGIFGRIARRLFQRREPVLALRA